MTLVNGTVDAEYHPLYAAGTSTWESYEEKIPLSGDSSSGFWR